MLSMDHLTSWINNRQLLSQIDPTDLNAVKDDIISNVFGGFDEMLKLILTKYNTLSLCQHHALETTLLTKQKGDVFDNYRKSEDRTISIANISDDCLSHICTFLDTQDRFIMQQSCRLFTVISRRESSFTSNSYFQYKGLHKITPNKQLLIDKLLSDDNIENIGAIQQIARYLKGIVSEKRYLHDIKGYSKSMSNIIRNIITNNILIDPSCLDLLIHELQPQNHEGNLLLPTAAKVLFVHFYLKILIRI